MGNLFSGNDRAAHPPPQLAPLPPVPTIDDARLRTQNADAMARRRGRRASVLTGGGVEEPTAKKTLIGS